MPNFIPQWSPQEVLKIEDIFTCSGWAHSKGRKCYNRIAKENRELATDIMDDMADLDIRSADFKASLKSLAKPLLCRAYHTKDPDQHKALRKQWGKHIEAYKVTVNARRRSTATAHVSASVRAESLQEERESLRAAMALLMQRTAEPARVEHGRSVVTSTRSTQSTRVHQTTSPHNGRQMVQIEAHGSTHLRSVSEQRTRNVASNAAISRPQDSASVEGNPPRSPLPTAPSSSTNTEAAFNHPASQPLPNSPSRQRTSHIAFNTTRSPPSGSASPEGNPLHSPLPTTPSSSANTEAASSPPASHPTPNTTPRPHHHNPAPPEMTQITPTTAHHATSNQNQSADHNRKAISGDCSICCEDLRGGENISWCKAQCGQNFHADCVGVWLDTLAAGRSRTCPYW